MYVGYKLKDGDEIHTAYLKFVLINKDSWSGWVYVEDRRVNDWKEPVLCRRLYDSELFQELVFEK